MPGARRLGFAGVPGLVARSALPPHVSRGIEPRWPLLFACQQTVFGVLLVLVGLASGQLTAGIGASDVCSSSYRFGWRGVGRVGRAGRCGPGDRLGKVSAFDWRATLMEALNAPGALGNTYTRFHVEAVA